MKKRIRELARKNKILAQTFQKKVTEVISRDTESIEMYQNLRAPQSEYKRIHLAGSHVLMFRVNVSTRHILFVDIVTGTKRTIRLNSVSEVFIN